MVTRIVSSIILFPLLVWVIVVGGLALKLTVLALVLIAMYELYNAFSKKFLPIHIVGYVFATIYLFFCDKLYDSKTLTVILILFVLSLLVTLLFFHEKITPIDGIVTMFGFFYIAVLLSTMYLVRMTPSGKSLIWLIFIGAWGCDTGAYFTGVFFGKHKLIPTLSPKKTVEGAIGGVVTATVLGIIYGFIMSRFYNYEEVNIIIFGAVASFISSILSICGDLTASYIKRYTGIKDYGKVIPGHGGILDRFDSVLFTAPAVYIVMVILS